VVLSNFFFSAFIRVIRVIRGQKLLAFFTAKLWHNCVRTNMKWKVFIIPVLFLLGFAALQLFVPLRTVILIWSIFCLALTALSFIVILYYYFLRARTEPDPEAGRRLGVKLLIDNFVDLLLISFLLVLYLYEVADFTILIVAGAIPIARFAFREYFKQRKPVSNTEARTQ